MQYIIQGGKKLKGEIKIAGNKNSTFPCFAAALLTQEEVILENIPAIKDVEILESLLKNLGVNIAQNGSTAVIKADKLKSSLPQDLMIKLRGSIVLVGAILARNGEVKFYFPGGDIIGRRSIDVHLECLKGLGMSLKNDDPKFSIRDSGGHDKIYNIFFPITSVTGTENLILASVLKNGTVILRNCAKEPHIVDLCRMLVSMGARIEGIGTEKLTINGVNKLHGTKFKLSPDHTEVGTYAVAAAITGGEIVITGIEDCDLDPILVPLSKFGLQISRENSYIKFSSDSLNALPQLVTNIWPGFPTDLMSVAIVLATQSKGVTLCHDWIFESRMFFVDKLISMGAKIIIADPHRVLVYGPTQLRARELETPDIRAGMALVLASLIAKGGSIINKADLIERGYEDVVGKLSKLGAEIKKV